MKRTYIEVLAAVIICAGAFYGGMRYARSLPALFAGTRDRAGQSFRLDTQNLSTEERQARLQQAGGFRQQGGSQGAAGEILSRDDTSMILKMRDGGSKIIFYSEATEVGKFVDGEREDLKVGESVMVSGSSNIDGSITAQSIQIRPLFSLSPSPAR